MLFVCVEVTISCMFALSDFTAANGATVVVPGSHLWEDYSRTPDAAKGEVAQAVMKVCVCDMYVCVCVCVLYMYMCMLFYFK